MIEKMSSRAKEDNSSAHLSISHSPVTCNTANAYSNGRKSKNSSVKCFSNNNITPATPGAISSSSSSSSKVETMTTVKLLKSPESNYSHGCTQVSSPFTTIKAKTTLVNCDCNHNNSTLAFHCHTLNNNNNGNCNTHCRHSHSNSHLATSANDFTIHNNNGDVNCFHLKGHTKKKENHHTLPLPFTFSSLISSSNTSGSPSTPSSSSSKLANCAQFTDEKIIPVFFDVASAVREKLVSISNVNPGYFDQNDLNYFVLSGDEHIMSYCQRFTHLYPDPCSELVDKTVIMMTDALKWRKSSTLSSLNELSFPIEFYSVGGLFLYTRDKANNLLLVFRLAVYQKIPELKEGMELFTTFQMFKAHNVSISDNLNGWSLIFDITDVTMAQYDLPQLLWLINTMLKYYPRSLKAVYILNTPWIFKKIANFINRTFIPIEWRSVLKFVSTNELREFISNDNLPDYLGGNCNECYRKVPSGALPVEEIAYTKYGMSKDECLRIKSCFDKFLPPEMRVNVKSTATCTTSTTTTATAKS